ncbi:serine--tRNA ligase [Paracoccus tibetensis]|uniref:Serine--tRNA ligase n=1 Tax=Paracoccus tibetensis TaxID=336292 RepID=A0A1G5J204_9RHOB|nr:serine--tRNA ligase [Paracoccus tibetensis]SCY81708.1 seryl-tRNA synthetase [Paracoccus tibetensis]
MHDIRAIRDNPEAFEAALNRRGLTGLTSQILSLDGARRERISAAETAQAEQNRASKDVGAAKARGEEAEFERLRVLVAEKKADVARMQAEAGDLDGQLRDLLLTIPNLPLESVPDGGGEEDNVELRRWGTPRALDFQPVEHFDIPAIRPGMDFATGAKLSGSRFTVLKGSVARLHRALAQFMIDLHITQHGLEETWTPVLVLEDMMVGTGQLPKFGEDSYQTREGYWLIPTSEVTLTNTVHGDLLDQAALPRRMVAHSQCFRSEAGSAGRDTTGMLRQHQFEKVEMVSITDAESGLAEHARMTRCAEAVLEALELPYRTIVLCTGDMGAGARITHDLEVWLPGQNRYREISSVSYCGDYQARRMNARYRPAEGGKPEFVHTLNGSGLAVGRALIAVVENGQQADGSVRLPAALRPYLGGAEAISAEGQLI